MPDQDDDFGVDERSSEPRSGDVPAEREGVVLPEGANDRPSSDEINISTGPLSFGGATHHGGDMPVEEGQMTKNGSSNNNANEMEPELVSTSYCDTSKLVTPGKLSDEARSCHSGQEKRNHGQLTIFTNLTTADIVPEQIYAEVEVAEEVYATQLDDPNALYDDSIAAMDQWRSYSDEQGRMYYYNHYTGASVWASEELTQPAECGPSEEASQFWTNESEQQQQRCVQDERWPTVPKLFLGGRIPGVAHDEETVIASDEALERNFRELIETPEGQLILQNEVERLETLIRGKAEARRRRTSTRDSEGGIFSSLLALGRRLTQNLYVEDASAMSAESSISEDSLSTATLEDIQSIADSSSSSSASSDLGSLEEWVDEPALLLDWDASVPVMHALWIATQSWASYSGRFLWVALTAAISMLRSAAMRQWNRPSA